MRRDVAIGLVTAALAGAVGAVFLATDGPAIAARISARVSFGAFVIAFAIAPLARRSRGEPAEVEREAWAAFVAAHFVHLAYLAINVLRIPDRPPLWRAGGGMLAYAVLGVIGLALLARSTKLRWLIDVGGLWIAFVFIVTYGGRAMAMTWSVHTPLFAVAVAAPIAHVAIVLSRAPAPTRPPGTPPG